MQVDMLKPLFLSGFFIITISLTGCLVTTEDAGEGIIITDSFSGESSFSWGGGSFGGLDVKEVSSRFGR